MDNDYKHAQKLHSCTIHLHKIIINRLHALIHCIAIAYLIYYRASSLSQHRKTPLLPWLLLFASELSLSFIWLLGQAYRWRPVSRTAHPENLPEDDKLPGIDVVICTADPEKEPTFEVMNTVLSAMALDYPADKLHVYLSDDGGADITLYGMQEAWRFARFWLPFCRRYGIKSRCPQAYFSESISEHDKKQNLDNTFLADGEFIKEKYEKFKENIIRASEDGRFTHGSSKSKDHPSLVEVIGEKCEQGMQDHDHVHMPLVVYVSREKRTNYPHHFKSGALNVLIRVSAMLSNSPYLLVLDCDMYSNDPSSARQAMCFHLDPNISKSLAFVLFPQKFLNLSENDIYDSEIRLYFKICAHGLDGLKGPVLTGTNFYIKREALYDNFKGTDLEELKNSFGHSREFVNSLTQDYKPNAVANEIESSRLASCTYEDHTKWGTKVGFLYHSVLEDYFTGFTLHCKGWRSVYLNPSRPQFLGSAITSLNDLLIQMSRWSTGLVEVAISRYFPLIYGSLRMSFLQSVCYSELAFFSLLYCIPLWCFATIPQICLFYGISLYPQASSSSFYVFLFIFISALSKHSYEVLVTGDSLRTLWNEQRIWMMKSVTSYSYGSVDAITKKLGIRKASFSLTNKVVDDEQVKRYQVGTFSFDTSTIFLAPLVTLIILNMVSLAIGVIRLVTIGGLDNMLIQILLPSYILIMGYPIIEGMVIRKDSGRIQLSVTLLSGLCTMIMLYLGSLVLMY